MVSAVRLTTGRITASKRSKLKKAALALGQRGFLLSCLMSLLRDSAASQVPQKVRSTRSLACGGWV